MLHTEQSPRSDCVRRFGGCRCCCFRLFSTAEMIGFNVDIPSWAFARQCCHSSAIRLTSFFVQPMTPAFVGCSAFFTPHSVDRLGFSLAFRILSWAYARQKGELLGFCDFRCPFTRQISILSGVMCFSVSVQSTIPAFVGCWVFFAILSADDLVFHRLFDIFSSVFSVFA